MALYVNATVPPHPIDLEDGSMVAPGELVDLEQVGTIDRGYVDSGQLVKASTTEHESEQPRKRAVKEEAS